MSWGWWYMNRSANDTYAMSLFFQRSVGYREIKRALSCFVVNTRRCICSPAQWWGSSRGILRGAILSYRGRPGPRNGGERRNEKHSLHFRCARCKAGQRYTRRTPASRALVLRHKSRDSFPWGSWASQKVPDAILAPDNTLLLRENLLCHSYLICSKEIMGSEVCLYVLSVHSSCHPLRKCSTSIWASLYVVTFHGTFTLLTSFNRKQNARFP